MRRVILLIILAISLFSCKKETSIGTDIVGDDAIDVQFQQYDLISTAKETYKTITYYDGQNDQVHLLGMIDDPILGQAKSNINFNFKPSGEYDFAGATIDSVVLSLKIDTSAYTGPDSEKYTFEVKSITENIDARDTIYVDENIAVSGIIGSKTETFIPKNTIKYYSPDVDSIVTREAIVRIKLDDTFGNSLMLNTTTEDEDFYAEYKGLQVTATPEGSHMLGILMNESTNALSSYNNIELYYTNNENEKKVAFYRIGTTNFSSYNIDHTGSIGEEEFSSDEKDYTYQQSMSGAYTELTLPNLSALKNDSIAINHAEIILEQAILSNDSDSEFYPYQSGFYLTYMDESEEESIIDIAKYGSFSTGLLYAGGKLSDEVVKFNCTDQINAYIQGDVDDKILVKNLSNMVYARKAIFYGSANAEKGPKLKITYTKF